MEPIRIVGLSVAAAVLYGLIHDQITAHLCVEYFSIAHPPLFGTENPTLLALGWGVVATWWVGALLGVPLAFAARWGSRPKVSARDFTRPVAQLLACMAVLAAAAGSAGWLLGQSGHVSFEDAMLLGLPPNRWVPFTAVAWTHSASYLAGFVGGAIVVTRIWRNRAKQLQVRVDPAVTT